MKPTAAMGSDQWSTEHIKAMAPECLESLANLLGQAEQQLAWPHQLLHVWYAWLLNTSKKEQPARSDP